MVVMIVADEDEVDPRQILEAHARRAHPLRADGGEGRGASDQIGSVRMLRPAVWTSTVAWPIQVTSISSPSTRRGGTVGVTGTRAGQVARSLEPAPAAEEAGGAAVRGGLRRVAGIEEALAVEMGRARALDNRCGRGTAGSSDGAKHRPTTRKSSRVPRRRSQVRIPGLLAADSARRRW